jgi:DNA-binding Xre family transcriptional regulator
MVRLRILAILEEQGHTKYWLYKRMDMMSYRNFQKIVDNETSSIRFETLDKLSRILNVPIGELFEQTEEMSDNEKN